MPFNVFMLLTSLGLILFSCVLFTNAVEWFGKKLGLHQGIIGSILAAVGTALPETIVPIIAIFFSNTDKGKDIAIGAIAGAPFMLSTLAFFVTGTAVFVYAILKKRAAVLSLDIPHLKRDLVFFIIMYSIAVAASFLNDIKTIKILFSLILLLGYVLYLKMTIAHEAEQSDIEEPLYFQRVLKLPLNLFWICVQLGLGLGLIIYGAHLFVQYVDIVSKSIGLAPFILSLIITPIATELPEKLNSVIWIGKKKDTLALGNITGAMVFQSCFPVSIGILCTPWQLEGIGMISAVLALCSACFVLLWIQIKKSLHPLVLLCGGLFYLAFLYTLFYCKN